MSDAKHIVRSYAQQLHRLRDLITHMGGMVENQLMLATRAVIDGDPIAATRAVEADPAVDAAEREAEQFVIQLLALRQPMAMDLRQIVASLKIIGGLERIGDYAANIAKRSRVLHQFKLPYSMAGISHMARLVQENLKLVIDAAGEADSDKAMRVWRSDQAIDDLYNAIFRELMTYMMEDPRNITPCTHLLFIARNLERIGDHATNVAETVHYAATGENFAEGRPKGESSAGITVQPLG